MCIRDRIDTVIRYGGDEFIIIFCCIPSDLFKKRLKIIRTSVNMLEFDECPNICVSISMGGIYKTDNPIKLFKIADDFMYKAKNKKNKGIVAIYDDKKIMRESEEI